MCVVQNKTRLTGTNRTTPCKTLIRRPGVTNKTAEIVGNFGLGGTDEWIRHYFKNYQTTRFLQPKYWGHFAKSDLANLLYFFSPSRRVYSGENIRNFEKIVTRSIKRRHRVIVTQGSTIAK